MKGIAGLIKTPESCSERPPFTAGVREGHPGDVGEGPVRDQWAATVCQPVSGVRVRIARVKGPGLIPAVTAQV